MLVMNGFAPRPEVARETLAASASQNEFIVRANLEPLSYFNMRFSRNENYVGKDDVTGLISKTSPIAGRVVKAGSNIRRLIRQGDQ
jgi:hypothetical protein